MSDDLNRRTFISTTVAASGAGLLAGCGGDGGSDSNSDSGGVEAVESSGGTETVESSSEVIEYVGESSNFDGNTVVIADEDTVSVVVGAEGNGGAFAFDSPAIQVSTGTTVVWEWTGQGGRHNVRSEGDGPLDSGSTVVEEGTTYEYTFEEAGTYLYQCTPHVTFGMVGAVVVE